MLRNFPILMLALLLFIGMEGMAQSKKKKKIAGTTKTDYEAVCAGTGAEGTQLIKVYFYFKKDKNAGIYAKMNGVQAVMFRGITQGSGCMKKPLVKPEERSQNEAYFEKFFEPGGEYLNYVNSTGGITERTMVGKQTKAAMVVSVNLAALRKKLEDDGIIKSLDYGF